ncbi:MAG: energy transducer TonB [Crocinitomicaceae bacterium]|nr:energy transducer TonB [Crocinitomicaceae bacterium]
MFALIVLASSKSFGQNYFPDTNQVFQNGVKDYYFLLESTKQGLYWDTIDCNSQIHDVHFYIKNNTADTITIGRMGIASGKIYYLGGGMGNNIIFPDSVLKIDVRPYHLEREFYDGRNCTKIGYGNFNSSCKFEYYRNDTIVKGSLSSWGTLKVGNEAEIRVENSDSTLNNTKTIEPKNNPIIYQKKDSVIEVKSVNHHSYESDTISEFNYPTEIDSNLLVPRVAYFIGGDSALISFLNQNFNQELIKKIGISGTIYASFIIDETGKVTKCQIVKSLHPELDAEFIRVLYLMPNWVPGICELSAYPEYEPSGNETPPCKYCKQKWNLPFNIK